MKHGQLGFLAKTRWQKQILVVIIDKKMEFGVVLNDKIIDNKLMGAWHVVQNYRESSNGVRIWMPGVKSIKGIENVKMNV